MEQLDVKNPASGDPIASVPVDSAAAVASVVARVRANQAEWEAIGIEGRYHWLGKLRDWLLDNSEQVLDTMQAETGKVRADAANEPTYLADLINFYGSRAAEFIGEEAVRPHSPLLAAKKLRVQYRPHPVVGIISPWNFPLVLALGDAIPALQAGAAVVIKPSEFTPLGLAEVVKAWKEEIGGPDVFDCVHGIGETGGALVDAVDFVQFTGSDRTGRKVMARAAETLTPVSLELGGKDPMIVLADADLDRAANAAAWGGMFNSGQVCMSVERIYVEEPAYDRFVAKLTAEVSKLRQGADGKAFGKEVGAMTSPNQVGIVEDHVDDALSSGAKALTGGRRVPGAGDYFEPTVLVDVDHSMKVMRDETFGPVVGVMKVRDAEEALRFANDSRYGLSGSVFGEKGRAERVARRVECGAVNVNDVLVNYFAMDVPMGGWKESGIGYRHGEPGIKKYCRSESLVITRFGGKREPTWYPYTRGRRGLVARIAQAFNARDWRRRLGLRG
ncbi:MAG TPA: aldehyde dehydrogenase family protein [Solirubrobacterales bacterium]|jgi:betaine-aldehyde dehydrogenase|nr:aldehyde dehydrogenase family protein [Solirubrobacterales bacterium]